MNSSYVFEIKTDNFIMVAIKFAILASCIRLALFFSGKSTFIFELYYELFDRIDSSSINDFINKLFVITLLFTYSIFHAFIFELIIPAVSIGVAVKLFG